MFAAILSICLPVIKNLKIADSQFGNYCQYCKKNIGIEVFYLTPTREYTYAPEIYGDYQLKSEMVNGRVYFKKGDWAIWWNGADSSWNIGFDSDKGSNRSTGYFINNVQCPHKITESNGKISNDGKTYESAGNRLTLKHGIIFRGIFILF